MFRKLDFTALSQKKTYVLSLVNVKFILRPIRNPDHCLDHMTTSSKDDNVITKLNLHQSAFSADFFNGDIQISETSLQALVSFPSAPPPPQKSMYCVISVVVLLVKFVGGYSLMFWIETHQSLT